jgi:Uma2 family endonuclease
MSSAARVMQTAKRMRKKTTPPPPAVPSLPVRRYTLEEYHHLIETGFFSENDRVELLNGWIVAKMGINPPHASAVTRLSRRLARLLGASWIIREQSAITIPPSDSEPEPDVVVVPGPEEAYDNHHPYPDQIVLLAEVADSSLAEDQGEKLQTYAAAKMPVYWIVNLVDRCVEVYTQPRGGKKPSYKKLTTYGPGDDVPVVIKGKERGRIPVKELLP